MGRQAGTVQLSSVWRLLAAKTERRKWMASYERVREIANSCSRNQMRDVFFSEIEVDDPEAYVRSEVKGQDLRLEIRRLDGGALCIYAESAGMFQKFLFTPLNEE